MAIQFVGGATTSNTGSTGVGTSIYLLSGFTGVDTTAIAGDLIIAVFATGSTADRTLSITDVDSGAYTLIGSELYANDNFDTNLRVAYKFFEDDVTDENTIFGPTGNSNDAGAMAVYVFRGVDPVTPFDGVTVVTKTETSTGWPDPDAITPSTAGAFIVVVGAAAHDSGVDTFNEPNDLVEFFTQGSNDTNDVTLGIGHKNDWTSGALDPEEWNGFPDSVTYSCASLCFVLRPAPTPVTLVSADASLGSGVRRRAPSMIAN